MYQSLGETDLWLPSEPLAGASDIGFPLGGIILRQRMVRHTRISPDYAEHLLGQLANRKFNRISEVHRLVSPLGRH
jgi:hypothetical protein